jgi:DNA/RNA-binding domain of Phe-tRNA-synthetase-like protein
MVPVTSEIHHADLIVGMVESHGVPGGPASAVLAAEIENVLAQRTIATGSDHVQSAVRDLLRAGGYKPAGRGKPASEYLAQAAARGEFPRISHIVDAMNLVSLESGFPISLIDASRAMHGTGALVIRLGLSGESYVFNAARHETQLEGLLTVARQNGPALANPVKDSMLAKTTDATTDTLALIWASRRATDATELAALCQRLGRRIGGAATEILVLGSGQQRSLP